MELDLMFKENEKKKRGKYTVRYIQRTNEIILEEVLPIVVERAMFF